MVGDILRRCKVSSCISKTRFHRWIKILNLPLLFLKFDDVVVVVNLNVWVLDPLVEAKREEYLLLRLLNGLHGFFKRLLTKFSSWRQFLVCFVSRETFQSLILITSGAHALCGAQHL